MQRVTKSIDSKTFDWGRTFTQAQIDPHNPRNGDIAYHMPTNERAWRNEEEWWAMENVQVPNSEYWDEDDREWYHVFRWVPTDQKVNPPDSTWLLIGSMIDG